MDMKQPSIDIEMLQLDIGFDGTWELLKFLRKQKELSGATPGMRLVANLTRNNEDEETDGPEVTFFLYWTGEDGQQEHCVGVDRLLLSDFKAFAKAVLAYKS
jgi:hypothetical protein